VVYCGPDDEKANSRLTTNVVAFILESTIIFYFLVISYFSLVHKLKRQFFVLKNKIGLFSFLFLFMFSFGDHVLSFPNLGRLASKWSGKKLCFNWWGYHITSANLFNLNCFWGWAVGYSQPAPHNWCLEKLTSGFGGHLIHINSASSKAKQEGTLHVQEASRDALHLLLGVTW
jgi:hypothetical protein